MLSSRLSPQTICGGLNPLGKSSAIQPPRFTRRRPSGEGLPTEKATFTHPPRPALAISPRTPGTGQPSPSHPAATTRGQKRGCPLGPLTPSSAPSLSLPIWRKVLSPFPSTPCLHGGLGPSVFHAPLFTLIKQLRVRPVPGFPEHTLRGRC